MPNGYQLIPRQDAFLGLGYQALISDWMSWLVMDDPDRHNNGRVVYLRGVDFPTESESYSSFIRTDEDRFIIGLDQAIFWPIIMYYVDMKHHPHASSSHERLTQIANLLSNGKPPEADDALISFNWGPTRPVNGGGYAQYQFISDDIDLEIPRQDYDNSKTLCPYLDVPMTIPGVTKCRVAGFFLLLTFNRVGTFIISSHGAGELGYETRTLVEVEVTRQVTASRAAILAQKQMRRRAIP